MKTTRIVLALIIIATGLSALYAYAADSLLINTREIFVLGNHATDGDLRRAQELMPYTLRLAPDTADISPSLAADIAKFPPDRLEAEVPIDIPPTKLKRIVDLQPNLVRLVSVKKVGALDFPSESVLGNRAISVVSPEPPEKDIFEVMALRKAMLVGWEWKPTSIDRKAAAFYGKMAKEKKARFKVLISEELDIKAAKELAKMPIHVEFNYITKDNNINSEWLAFLKKEQKKNRTVGFYFSNLIRKNIKESLSGFSALELYITDEAKKGVFPSLIETLKSIGHPVRIAPKPATRETKPDGVSKGVERAPSPKTSPKEIIK